MNLTDSKYKGFSLVAEILETAQVVKDFDQTKSGTVAQTINSVGKLILTGEGSSRIFPAKNTINNARKLGIPLNIITEGSHQASQYKLNDYAVFCASNSGKTKEVIKLAHKVKSVGNRNCFGVTANNNTTLEGVCSETFVLKCGTEKALAATKSVVETALFYDSILWNILGENKKDDLLSLGTKIESVLAMQIDNEIIEAAAKATTIYYAGYNDGAAEELTLKTNEIARKKSDYLEGTYAVHGIEEVMDKNDLVFLIDPIEEEIEKFQQVLEKGVGLTVVAISTYETPFKTIRIPDAGIFNPYLFLCAGWNMLVEIGLALGINLDKAERARKIGNELIL
jgi:glucosamine--fructose-6-phosphate aminotransferase (isomerizing)